MNLISELLSLRHKNNKFFFYVRNFSRLVVPASLYPQRFHKKLLRLPSGNIHEVIDRVNYYNKVETIKPLQNGVKIKDFKFRKKHKTYFFDTYKYIRYFNPELKFSYRFGDITQIPETPALVKSRPISSNNENSVLLKLNKVRHFHFVHDSTPFTAKKDKLVWRGHISKLKTDRIRFLKTHFSNPLCNIGCTNRYENHEKYIRGKMSIDAQLGYKFILCIEGNDVASNLKWVMSSNSLAVMPRPKYETWFMEGRLVPDYHYVEIREDFSDLEQKINFFCTHPKEAQTIIDQANLYVSKFKHKKREDFISLLVLDKYFQKTNPGIY